MKPRSIAFFSMCLAAAAGLATAAPPPLREQVSLNGEWPVGGTVPTYTGVPNLGERVYERDVIIPATAGWKDRVIKIEFGAVNFVAEVFVNGTPVAEHVGGWCPFAVDVTRWAKPGEALRLKVLVKGPGVAPVVDERGAVARPVGGWYKHGGIAEDVWLRAYGMVQIEDAFIQTSVARKELAVDYTLHNADRVSRTISVAGQAALAAGGEAAVRFTSAPVTFAPGATKVVKVAVNWHAPSLYWPDQPTLYHLTSRVIEGGVEIDRETRRFGFREITVRGNQFHWNGVRANLFGDYQVFGDTWYLDSARWHSPAAWPATVDKIKAMNLRVLRWHHNPVPQYLLDVADEKGLLICDEAANYARDLHKKTDQTRYLAAAKQDLPPWIRADRNHPCIYLWNATNEMTHSFCGPFEPAALVELGEIIRRLDPTRPVGYDGDNGHPGAALKSSPGKIEYGPNTIHDSELVDHHYPEGYNREPVGSIYGWAHLVEPDKPTGSGELLHTRSPLPAVQAAVERNTWWLGIWMRGLRATDWTNVKPACWWFTEKDLASDNLAQRQRSLNLRNALARVALFDKAYDDLGIAPYVTGITPGGTLPALVAGARERRTLILYNDEFRDPSVMIEVIVQAAGKTYASGRKDFMVELGHHREIPYGFQVPHLDGFEVSVFLRTYKRGVMKFEEARRFVVRGGKANADTANEVTF